MVLWADSLLFLFLTLQVIAVVMDVFTDIDIFRDLQEISRKQGVAVYILLDQALLSQFLDMCMDLKVHPEQEKVCILLCGFLTFIGKGDVEEPVEGPEKGC